MLSEGRVIIRVSDTGAGMEQEELEQLRARLEKDEATGFGVNSAYKRLRLMYGAECQFTIESQSGVGTDITIRIPLKKEEAHETTV